MNTNTASARARPFGRTTAFGGRRPDRIRSPLQMDRVDREARPMRITPPDRPHAHDAPRRIPGGTPPSVPMGPVAVSPRIADILERARRWAVRRTIGLSTALQSLAQSASRLLGGQSSIDRNPA